ncbi:MAG: PKD domain-containing protein [Bacteroidota bacterium]
MLTLPNVSVIKILQTGVWVLLLSLVSSSLLSQVTQKEGNIWYFGQFAGLDFNTTPPQALTNGQLTTSEGCATICNRHGNLLFYTDGTRVFDKTHAQMPKGDSLTGNPSSTQSGIIVPNPDSAHIYYVFTTSGGGIGSRTAYSVVDTNLNGGKGDLKIKNVILNNRGGEKLTAVKHSNGKDFWIITHQNSNDSFLVYLVTGAGVNTTPLISRLGSRQSNFAVGYLKAAPNGKKLVGVEYASMFAEMYDFNPSTGIVSNAQILDTGKRFYGVEFSPSGDKLYITTTTVTLMELAQYDLKAGSLSDIIASKTIIKNFTSPSNPGALQLAPDGKIYMAILNSTFLSVIEYPEKIGASCGYMDKTISLNGRSSMFGLPTFMQSYFKVPTADISIEEATCGKLTFNMGTLGDTSEIISSFWDFGDGTTANNSLFVSKTYTKQNTYTVKFIIHFGGDYPKTDTIVKTIKTKQFPKAGFVANYDSQCFKNNNYQFTDTSVYLNASVKGKSAWTFLSGNKVVNDSTIVQHTYGSNGPKQVQLKVTSNEGCSDSVTQTYTVKPSVVANFSVGGDQCYNTNRLQPYPFSIIDTPAFISGYAWDFGDGTSDTAATPIKVYKDTGNYTVRLVTLADNGCHDTAFNNFAVNPSPKATFIVADVCQHDSLLISNTSTIKKGTLTYKWWYGDGHTDTVFEKNRLYKDTGVKTLKLVATSEMFCSDSITNSARVIPVPVAAFSADDVCDDSNISFVDNTQRFNEAVLENKWFFGDGAQQQNTGNAQHTYNDTGWRTVKLYTKSVSGCFDSIEKQIFINPRPQVNFYTNDSLQCLAGNYFTFSESVVLKRGTVSLFQWKFNDTLKGAGPFWDGAIPSSGLYDIKLIAVTDSGCIDSVTKQVTVWPQASLAVSVNDTSQCLGGNSFIINNNSTISQGSLSNLWRFSSGQTFTTVNPPPVSFATPGIYRAWLVSNSDKGCKDSIFTNLYIEYNPKADFVKQTICENDSAYFVNTTTGDASGWQWYFGDGGSSVMKEPIYKYQTAGVYKVTLVGRSANGCGDTVVKDSGVVVSPAPKVYFTAEIGDNVSGNTNVNFINKTLFGDNFSWAFGNGGFSRAKNPSESYKDTGYFKVILSAINNYNCFDEFDTILYLAPDYNIVIPNAFTPNKDPLNPVFKIEGTYYYRDYEMKIFDRWGKLLFVSNNPAEGWNGEYESTLLPDGVYTYTIRLTDYLGKVRIHRGTLHLMR